MQRPQAGVEKLQETPLQKCKKNNVRKEHLTNIL